MRTDIVVVDEFLADPQAVRAQALEYEYFGDTNFYQGKRSEAKPFDYAPFETLLQKKITKWDYPVNGAFQFTTAEDKLVYHMDNQMWAGVIYLTPNAPPECGTSFFRAKRRPWRMDPRLQSPGLSEEVYHSATNQIFAGGFFDSTQFDEVDRVGNVFNRLVLWNAKLIHSATKYFGTDIYNARLFQMFFFDTE